MEHLDQIKPKVSILINKLFECMADDASMDRAVKSFASEACDEFERANQINIYELKYENNIFTIALEDNDDCIHYFNYKIKLEEL